MEKIEIKVLTLKSAIEINSPQAGRDFIIEEMMLGVGSHRKALKYTNGMLNYASEHKAEILPNGKIRIV